MRRFLTACLTAASLLTFSSALASFHLFVFEQLYSNADGSVQFIVARATSSGQNFLPGQTLSSSGSGGPKSFTFGGSPLSGDTNGRHVLIGTQGFAALGIVAPDYTVPNGFLSLTGGQVRWPGGPIMNYSALPTDGVLALTPSGATIPNVATNYAGASGSVQPAAAITPKIGNWSNPNETGTGFAFDFQHGSLVVVFFSFQANGAPLWYIASGPLNGNTFTGQLDKFKNGQCIMSTCGFVSPLPDGNDGPITIVFTSNTSGNMTLPGGRVIPITPTVF